MKLNKLYDSVMISRYLDCCLDESVPILDIFASVISKFFCSAVFYPSKIKFIFQGRKVVLRIKVDKQQYRKNNWPNMREDNIYVIFITIWK